MRRCIRRATVSLLSLLLAFTVSLALFGGSFACGPIEYVANTPFEAAGAVSEAKHVKADKYALYELTAAQEYLHKSRELAGYARFHSSVEFARKATKMARQARSISKEKQALPDEPPLQCTPPNAGTDKPVETPLTPATTPPSTNSANPLTTPNEKP